MLANTASFSVHGIGVSNGIAIGQAHLVSNALLEVVHYQIEDHLVDDEVQRFCDAVDSVKESLNNIDDQLPEHAPADLKGFIGTHLALLADKSLSEVPKIIIAKEHCNAEWALKRQMDDIVAQFDAIEDPYLRERKQDVIQVVERVLKELLGHANPATKQSAHTSENETILVAHDISPADAFLFKQHHYAAFITQVGGATSHTAILARSLNIPSIVAIQRAYELINDGETIIVDGTLGIVIVNPSKEVLAEYELKQKQWQLEQKKLQRIKTTKAVTIDGTCIDLLANIEVPSDVESARAAGATGIGLYRTEFLFMNKRDMPDEDEQFEAYKTVAESMHGMPVTIRTLDLGADKQLSSSQDLHQANPALSLRAVRYCLSEPAIFHTQFRALLRASHYGKIKILIPMISTLVELRQTKILLERAKQSLREQNIPFDEDIALGGMIEVPAAAINADALAKELDFLSIGTNDLIQYTLAIDRTDESVAHLYNPLHPSVLKLIQMTAKAAQKRKIALSVCGEMAGDNKLTRLLIGLGLRQLSMHPSNILSVKQKVLHSELEASQKQAKKMLAIRDAEKIGWAMQAYNSITH